MGERRTYAPTTMSPLQQLRAGRLVRRVTQLLVGLALYGFSIALMVRADLGLDPWDTLHQGLARHVPLSFGTIVIIVGAAVLALWIPLRQRPGLGTVLNVVVIGLTADLGLALVPAPDALPARTALLLGGVLLNAVSGAAYVSTHLGPGPRDGLAYGLVTATGRSVRLLRTGVEVAALVIGWLLGGTVGVGTVLYAAAIGPLLQLFLPWLAVSLPAGDRADAPERGGPPAA